ncbi:hypothetical protein CU254_41865 (plasmid) [Amycolatopsis sp. AA4]|uniref:hypothetical protein n=1 Tax=Actinomycetes TaxID=1760 RepID=UPI0001B5713B|nr:MULTISPECIES: hypothetical protein [Actinomycetes]ATY17127.1 hypothetical protein CU254_41865 [Amycolatopsis sp. AA4]EFL12642.1 predicted protein [Streptomyces sp. AA4]
MRIPLSYTSASNASELFNAAYPELPRNTRTVWAMYVERFPGEADFQRRPFEVVWLADSDFFTPCSQCAPSVASVYPGRCCPGTEVRLQETHALLGELLGQPVALREFDIDDRISHNGIHDHNTARHVENMLRRAWENGAIGFAEDAADFADLMRRWDGEHDALSERRALANSRRGLPRALRRSA